MAFASGGPVLWRRRCRIRRSVCTAPCMAAGDAAVAGSQLIWCQGLSKSYDGVRTQLEGADFILTRGAKVGVVGVNGTGKSTLLRLLAGKEVPDSGTVASRKGLRLVYVEQDPIHNGDLTALDTVFAADTFVNRAIRDYEQVLTRLERKQCGEEELQRVMNRMDAVQAWDVEANARQILSRMGLGSAEILSRKVKDLSGGQQKRIALAAALVQEPDVLMLDEPTNHLDIDAIEWLESALRSPLLSVLLVTHDRYFLDRSCDEILELDRGSVFQHPGYEKYLEGKARRLVEEDRLVQVAKNRLRKEAEWMRRQPKARGTKSKARVEQFYSLRAQSQQRGNVGTVELAAKVSRIGNKVLEFKTANLAFGEQCILRDFSYEFKRGDRIGIVGENGVGKTSFLRVLMQQQALDHGEVVVGETVVFGYYSQQGTQMPEKVRVFDYVKEILSRNDVPDPQPISVLQKFGFEPEQMYTEISRLSGGERRRLQLLEVMSKDPNFLVLDEVTNDLDLQTLTLLENFLVDYRGVLVVVSHDRFFMDRVTKHLFVFEGQGEIKDFVGSFSEFLDFRREEAAFPASLSPSSSSAGTDDDGSALVHAGVVGNKTSRKDTMKKKMSNKERKEYSSLLDEIDELTAEQERLEASLSSGQQSSYEQLAEWTDQLALVTTSIDTKSARWLELAEEFGEQ